MLKKEETLKGAIVEVFQIKKGVPGGEHLDQTYVLITAEGGSVLDGGKGAPVGSRLEIIDQPKKRHGIMTVIVKFKTETGDFQGHVYWCELRASCKLVQAAPAPSSNAAPKAPTRSKKSGAAKTFTEKQMARLPDSGYWICTHPGGSQTFYCVLNGAVKYIHSSHGTAWNTLLWSCCPTRKQIAAGNEGTYEHFVDHASMLARHPDIKEGARVKAPNDL